MEINMRFHPSPSPCTVAISAQSNSTAGEQWPTRRIIMIVSSRHMGQIGRQSGTTVIFAASTLSLLPPDLPYMLGIGLGGFANDTHGHGDERAAELTAAREQIARLTASISVMRTHITRLEAGIAAVRDHLFFHDDYGASTPLEALETHIPTMVNLLVTPQPVTRPFSGEGRRLDE